MSEDAAPGREITVRYTSVFARTAASKKKIIVNVGGARSSKSYSVAQLLVSRFLTQRKKKIIITRKTFPALKATAMADVLAILQDWGVYDPENHNKTDSTITNPALGNIIRFISVDAPIKIRSMDANYIWMEEANEFEYQDFLTLKTRLSTPSIDGERNQMFLTLNPSDAYGWVNMKLVNAATHEADKDKSDVEVIVSSYKDNPALDADYIMTLEGLKDEDETYYLIFTKGVWAASKSIIYSNYEIVKASAFPETFDERFGGLDFGFNNPASATFVGMKDDEPWVREIVYQSRLTNAQLIDKVKEEFPQWKRVLWRADEAEPDRIQEFKDAGFTIEAAPKGKNSLRDGIDFCKRRKWHIDENSINVVKEVRGYKWKEKDGLVLDEPVKFMDHAMDSIRYAITALKSFAAPQAVGSKPGIVRGQRVRHLGRSVGDPGRYGGSRY